ncbi:MAG: hypothetical protein BWZ10_00252 [candidate division BRC1 bacterium ADurb.BinA364]|nr:MAG: hypothetical protein BWZ10_00252 [candidate division BRC1 bacterium ADurb.BinA364]
MVEVQGDRDFRIVLHGRHHDVLQIHQVGVLQSPAGGLNDHRRLGRFGRRHDGLDLLHVVDVEGANAVIAFDGFVKQLSHWNEGHLCDSLPGEAALKARSASI